MPLLFSRIIRMEYALLLKGFFPFLRYEKMGRYITDKLSKMPRIILKSPVVNRAGSQMEASIFF